MGAGSANTFSKDTLEVKTVGSYKVSVAKNIEDIERVNSDVFKLPENIEHLLRKLYEKDFGFVICKLDLNTAGTKAHPIGYTHPLLESNRIFVPTMHEHNNGEELPYWDHEIFSLGTNDGVQVPFFGKKCHLDFDRIPKNVKMPQIYSHGANYRVMKMKGKLENRDLYFSMAPLERSFGIKFGYWLLYILGWGAINKSYSMSL